MPALIQVLINMVVGCKAKGGQLVEFGESKLGRPHRRPRPCRGVPELASTDYGLVCGQAPTGSTETLID